MVHCRKVVAGFAFLLNSCGGSDGEIGAQDFVDNPFFQGSDTVASAAPQESKFLKRDLSAVTLVFHGVETEDVEVFRERTQESIEFSAVESDGLLAITFRLNSDERTNVVLKFLGTEGKAFRASLFPTHALETYSGLEAQTPSNGTGVPLVYLRDHGKEDFLLREGQALTVPYNDMVTLWNGTRLTTAARARIANSGSGLYSVEIHPAGYQSWVAQEGGVLTPLAVQQLGENSGYALMVSPGVCGPVELNLVRKD